jgi:hypothetical protein
LAGFFFCPSVVFLLPFCCFSVAFLLSFCSPFPHSSAPGYGQITLEHAVHYADLCAKELGCDEEQDVLSCMQSRDIEDIIRSMTYIMGGNPKCVLEIIQLNSNMIQGSRSALA